MTDLHYPFDKVPALGQWLPVAEGIYWLRMSLPIALDHINLYVLEDEEGWWIIDTGMRLDTTRACWEQLFAGPMSTKPVLGVIVTHYHPDHSGQAGWLCEKWQVPLYMSFGEYFYARTFSSMGPNSFDQTTARYFYGAGLSDDIVEQIRAKFRGFGALIEPLPNAYHRQRDGDVFDIGGRRWQVVVGSGHSPEHVCLFNEQDKLLFSGDQIIPKITSNVSVMPTEPQGNPLKDWFDSLQYLLDILPSDTLVFPAHNTPFTGVHERLQFLIEHHDDHLQAVEEACITPKTAMDMLPVLFSREIDMSLINIALGEAIAHLNYLVSTKRVKRHMDDGGVYHYTPADPSVQGRVGRVHNRDPVPMKV